MATKYFAGSVELVAKSIHHVGKDTYGTPEGFIPFFVIGLGCLV